MADEETKLSFIISFHIMHFLQLLQELDNLSNSIRNLQICTIVGLMLTLKFIALLSSYYSHGLGKILFTLGKNGDFNSIIPYD